jgi:hypothetical protein
MAEEQVLTPGGLRLRSRVHKIDEGTVLDGANDRLRALDVSGGILADFGTLARKDGAEPLMPGNVVHPPGRLPAMGSGWITNANWTNRTGAPLSSFATTWVVPQAPSTQSGQTVFLFNGVQNSTNIYQPVLQWGASAAGGGNYWAVASWYVDGQSGPTFHSNLVNVNSGDLLVGIITLTQQSGSNFSYNCQFRGIANTALPIQNVQELTWLFETLECYGITKCTDYPAAHETDMKSIDVMTGGTRPSVAWTPANAVTDCGQHTIVVSNSASTGEVDLFYNNLTGTGWRYTDLTAVAAAPVAAGPPNGYTWSVDNTQHVVYEGNDAHIHELYYSSNAGWRHGDLTANTGAPPAAGPPTGSPNGYTWSVDNTEHVVYEGNDSHIHELYYSSSANWRHGDLTANTGAPMAAGPPYGYTWSVDNTEHVVYEGNDSHIHELYYSYNAGAWRRGDLTAATGAPVAAGPPNGSPKGYTWSVDNTEHVVYEGSDAHIHDLYYSYNAGAWRHTDLTAAAGAPGAAGPPYGYTWSVDNTQHVVYEGSDAHIHELHFSSNAGWGHTDLTAATGAPPAAGPPNGSPNGYTWSVDNTQHVVYQGNDSHIHELHFSSNAGWGHTDLTAAAGAPVASGPPNGYTWSVDNTQHVIYRGSDAHIYDLYFHL